MSPLRIAVIAAALSVVLWALKAVAIGIAGGLDESPLEGPLFLLGLLAFVTAFVAGGVALMASRSTVMKIAAGIAGAVVAIVLVVVFTSVMVELLPSSIGWPEEEAGLWLASLFALALMLGWQQSQQRKGVLPA